MHPIPAWRETNRFRSGAGTLGRFTIHDLDGGSRTRPARPYERRPSLRVVESSPWRESHPRPSPYQGDALLLSYTGGRSGWRDSHPRPLVPQTSALLAALHPGFLLLFLLCAAELCCLPALVAQLGRLLLDLDQPLLDLLAAVLATTGLAQDVERDLVLLVLGTPLS